MGEEQWGYLHLSPVSYHRGSTQQQGMCLSCPLVMGMSARPALSDPALGERGTVFAQFEDQNCPFYPWVNLQHTKKGSLVIM